MAKKERTKLIGKIVMIAFLVMIVIGFTVPIILNNIQPSSPQYIEPRLCTNDAQCYLTCNNLPLPVLCSNNLCHQNSCDEPSVFLLQQTPTTFTLAVSIDNKILTLQNRTNSNNFYITFNNNKVNLFAPSLSLNHVLEKVNMRLQNQCLVINNTPYCATSTKSINVTINDKPSLPYGEYIPQPNDNIQLVYS